MTPEEVLNKAADLIEKRGLAKGTYFTNDGRYCSLGALRSVSGLGVDNESLETEEYRLAVAQLYDQVYGLGAFDRGIIGVGIPQWNDKDEVTANDVVQMMRKAASSGSPDQSI